MNTAALLALPVLALAPLALLQESGPDAAPSGGLFTLYAHDDLASSFDFRTGGAGGFVQDGEIRLTQAQIAYGPFESGKLSFGFVRNERVAVLDLGTLTVPPLVRGRDQAAEFPISVVHTLFFDGARFAFRGPSGDVDALERADRILGSLPPEEIRHLEPQVAHTYLVRVQHERESQEEFYAFQVVDLEPGRSLTMRWVAVPRR